MTRQDIQKTVFEALSNVAPEAEPESVDPEADLREELDLDSMDFMNFIIGLHEALKLDIPEADYPKYFTLAGCVSELSSRLDAR